MTTLLRLATVSAIMFALTLAPLPAQSSSNDNVVGNLIAMADAKILAAGVPAGSLKRIREFIEKNKATKIKQDVYTCRNQAPENTRPCDESARSYGVKEIAVLDPRHVVSIDFALPSTKKRMFLIDLATGDVESFFVSHGRGSGVSKWAYKFSNIKDSKQTSLGLYQTGETYFGHYGEMIRLYGLERSNDQAYNRDIVVHQADYAKPEIVDRLNRLGLSWGCPAVSPEVMAKIRPILRRGVIYDFYHSELIEAAQSGHEVKTEAPND